MKKLSIIKRDSENKKGNAELKGINGQQNCERDSQSELMNKMVSPKWVQFMPGGEQKN